MRDAGKRVAFVTNDPRHAGEEFVQKLWGMGVRASLADVMPDGLWPGTGAILAAVEVGSGREAAIVGKPEPQLFFTALDRLGDGSTLVIGDRLDADIAAAEKARLDAALVLTGGTTREEADAAKKPRPVAVADDLASLVNGVA